MENLEKPECSVQTYSGSVTHCIIEIIVYISINKFTVSEGFIWIKRYEQHHFVCAFKLPQSLKCTLRSVFI